jgi:hypothetical protein
VYPGFFVWYWRGQTTFWQLGSTHHKAFFLNNGPHTTELLHSGKFNHTSGLSRAFARHLKRMCMLKKVRGFYMELVYNPGRCCGFFNILCRVIFLNN